MAKQKIEVDLILDDNDTVEKAERKAKSLKQELKEMKELLASGTLDNDQFNKLSREAGQLQDRIGDVNQKVKNLASDSRSLDGFIDLTQGIVGGFAAVQGITALVGDENEDLQKTMVKLQATMSALSGIQAIVNTLQKESAAITTLQALRTGALNTVQVIYTAVTGKATAATRGFTIALAATGIGVIVIALGAAAYAMGAFGDATDDATEALERQKDAIERRNAANRELDEEDLSVLKAKTEVEKERLKQAGGTANQLIDLDVKVLKYKKLSLEQQYKDAKGNADAQGKIYVELVETQKEITLKGLEQEQNIRDEKAKQKEQREKQHQARLAQIRKEAQEFDDRDKKARIEALEEEFREKEEAIERERELAQKRQELVNQQRDAELSLKRSLRERDKVEAEQEARDYQAVWDAKTSIAQSGYSILNSLGELALGEQFKQTTAGKVLALAQIATDTALAFVSGLRIAQQSALGTGPGAALAFPVFYASQAAAVLSVANKAKGILSGGGSAGSPGVPGLSNFNSQPPSLRGFVQDNTRPQKEQRVYVLEKDITDTQGRVARIRSNAEII